MSRIFRILAILLALAIAVACGGSSGGTSDSGGAGTAVLTIATTDAAAPAKSVSRAVVSGFPVQTLTLTVAPQTAGLPGAQTVDLTPLLVGTSASATVSGLMTGSVYDFTVTATSYENDLLCTGTASASILETAATPVSVVCNRTAPVEGVYQFFLDGANHDTLYAYDNATGTATSVATGVKGAALNLDLDTINPGFEPDGMNSAHVIFHDGSNTFYRVDTAKAGSLTPVQVGDAASSVGVDSICEVSVSPNPGSPIDSLIVFRTGDATCTSDNATYVLPLSAAAADSPMLLGEFGAHGDVMGVYDTTGTMTKVFIIDNSGANSVVVTANPDLTGASAPIGPSGPLGTIHAYPSEPAADGSTVMLMYDNTTDNAVIVSADGASTPVTGLPAGLTWPTDWMESYADGYLIPLFNGTDNVSFYNVALDGTSEYLGNYTSTGNTVTTREIIKTSDAIFALVNNYDFIGLDETCYIYQLEAGVPPSLINTGPFNTNCDTYVDEVAVYGDTIYVNLYDDVVMDSVASTISATNGVTTGTGRYVGFFEDGYRANYDVGYLVQDDGTGTFTIMNIADPTGSAVVLNPSTPLVVSASEFLETFTVDTMGFINVTDGLTSTAYMFEFPRGGGIIPVPAQLGNVRMIMHEEYKLDGSSYLYFREW